MEINEQDLGLRTIGLRDLWGILTRRFLVMLLAAAVVIGGAFAYNQLLLVPRYESTATLYLVNQKIDEDSGTSTYDTFNLALKLANDCNHLINSHSVLDEAIQALSLDMTYEQLYECVTVTNPEETRILEVTVQADSPEQAKQIVDEICVVGVQKIEEAMGFEQAKLYEYGVLNEEPCNEMGLVSYLILGFAAVAAVYLFYLVRFLLDDRLRTEEDVERMLGLSILGDIPNADDPKRGRTYYKGGYGGKGCGQMPSGQEHIEASQPRGQLPVDPLPRSSRPAHVGRSAKNAKSNHTNS